MYFRAKKEICEDAIIGYKTEIIGQKIFIFIWCKVCECYKQQITSQLKGSVRSSAISAI